MARKASAGDSGSPSSPADDILREAEKLKSQLSSVLEQSPVIIIITDTEGKVEYVNRKFSEVTGYDLAEVAGKTPRTLKSGETPVEVYKSLWQTITSGSVWTGEFHNRKKSGGHYWVHASIAPIKNSQGDITNFIAMEEDFTERKNAEDALFREQKRVEELSHAKDIFMQNITHELKTPLSVILGNISLLRDMAPKESAQDWTRLLDMEERNAIRLRRSIEQILQLGKLDSAELKKETVQLDKLLQDIYLEHLPIANMKGIDLNIALEKAEISADRELLRLALSNLVSNAVKFTEKGEVQISMKSLSDSVSVTVTDSGIGVSPENQAKLFQKFFKADPNAPGSGIGLALSGTIFNKHGGKITVKSELGKGSAFEVVLPRGG
ncbi:Methanogenesis regulatory histidine kinase FilI [uncultured archaeon]|nr:Methanogenesis regulatory histidine kinase FilI [uncultured archaeon]